LLILLGGRLSTPRTSAPASTLVRRPARTSRTATAVGNHAPINDRNGAQWSAMRYVRWWPVWGIHCANLNAAIRLLRTLKQPASNPMPMPPIR
jgi:hypothetical protein